MDCLSIVLYSLFEWLVVLRPTPPPAAAADDDDDGHTDTDDAVSR